MHLRSWFHVFGMIAFFQFIVNARCMKFSFVAADGTSHVFPIDLPVLSNAPVGTIVRIQLGQNVVAEIPYKSLNSDFELDIERSILQAGDNIFNVYYINNNDILQEFSFTVSAIEEDSIFVSGVKYVYKMSISRVGVIASRTRSMIRNASERFIMMYKRILDALSMKILWRKWAEFRANENVEMVFNRIPTYDDFLRMKSRKQDIVSSQALKQWAKKAVRVSVALLGLGAFMHMFRFAVADTDLKTE